MGAGGRREEELREKYRRTHTAMREIVESCCTAQGARLRLGGWSGGAGGRSKREGIYLYMYIYTLGKEMATHSSIFAWRIPWTEEPGGPRSIGSQRVGHD